MAAAMTSARGAAVSAYGAAGSLIALLLWIYYSALIFFFGAVFTRQFALRFGKAADAADQWEAHMKKAAGNDYVINTKFNCETRFDDVAEAAFKDVPVNAITIGYGLPTERCR
ncbi:hypothetical protein G6F57_017648 [Rhizopus arrhizus]|nr:hypothetical protein G6F57_017648 [Rhizopus arrhizus]